MVYPVLKVSKLLGWLPAPLELQFVYGTIKKLDRDLGESFGDHFVGQSTDVNFRRILSRSSTLRTLQVLVSSPRHDEEKRTLIRNVAELSLNVRRRCVERRNKKSAKLARSGQSIDRFFPRLCSEKTHRDKDPVQAHAGERGRSCDTKKPS